jgi:hypothetical protein
VRGVLDHLRRDENLGDAAQVGELAVVRIELRIGSETSIVLGDLFLRRRAPNARDDEFLFGVDLVCDWQGILPFADTLKLALRVNSDVGRRG